jgi:hypothetical protein
MDPHWIQHFADFYASGAFEDIGRFGVRAAKSDSVCRAVLAESLLMRRKLEPNIIGVCPVISSTTKEAGDRFETLKEGLRAFGYRDIAGERKLEVDEPFTYKTSGGGSQALQIEFLDAVGHRCQFRIYAATENIAGCTAIAGFGDELDLWGKAGGANPAKKVLRVLRSRFATVPQAKLHLMSATYDRDSEHAALIKLGNVHGQFVARLGIKGSAKDYEDRQRLAKARGLTDPLLLAPPLPADCTDIPSWVTNPIAPIESAYDKSKGDLRDMFSLYGGRPDLAGGKSSLTLEDALFLVDANRELSRSIPAEHRSTDGLFDYGDTIAAMRDRGL